MQYGSVWDLALIPSTCEDLLLNAVALKFVLEAALKPGISGSNRTQNSRIFPTDRFPQSRCGLAAESKPKRKPTRTSKKLQPINLHGNLIFGKQC